MAAGFPRSVLSVLGDCEIQNPLLVIQGREWRALPTPLDDVD